MGASDADWRGITSGEYKLFLAAALVIALMMLNTAATVWLLALPALIVVGSTIGRVQTVNRQRRREIE